MIFKTPQVLLFSLNENLVKSFERYVSYTEKEFKERANFKLIRENNSQGKLDREISKALEFEDPSQLLFLLEDKKPEELANLILIIDIYNSKGKNNLKSVIQDIVVQYPEVKILFISFNDDWVYFFPKIEPPQDEKEKENKSIDAEKNGKNKAIDIKVELPSIHSFNPFEKNALRLAVNGNVNLFDASNLRNYLKQNIFSSLKTHTNYPLLQKSRAANLALAIDEERHQTFFNSYTLFKYGFRVLPITTFNELYFYKNNTSKFNNHLKLIIRDYDLQFEDYDEIDTLKNLYSDRDDLTKDNILKNLRGVDKPDKKFNNSSAINFDLIWSPFYDSSETMQTYFVTRISAFEDNDVESVEKICVLDSKQYNHKFNNCKKGIQIDSEEVYLRGINKPVDGFQEFFNIEIIKDRAEECNDKTFFDIKRDVNLGSHSVSPKILHIGEALLKRAEKCFDNKMYIVSAVLAQEALEVLNGFHFLVMLGAVYQKAISETHIETESIGIKSIGTGAKSRFQEIKINVNRICRGNKEAEKNVLSQIFNDVRHIYKENEQFEAADEALKEFISINHKISYDGIFERVIRSIKNSTKSNWNEIKSLKRDSTKKKLKKTKFSNTWFEDFGKGLIPYLILVIILFLFSFILLKSPKSFAFFFILLNSFILLLFAFHKKLYLTSLVYILIGRTPELRWLLTSFIVYQLFFAGIYYFYLLFSSISTFLYIDPLKTMYNVLYTTLSNQTSQYFESIINPDPSNYDLDLLNKSSADREGFFLLIIIQLAFSYVYLGLFISTLYQKLKKE